MQRTSLWILATSGCAAIAVAGCSPWPDNSGAETKMSAVASFFQVLNADRKQYALSSGLAVALVGGNAIAVRSLTFDVVGTLVPMADLADVDDAVATARLAKAALALSANPLPAGAVADRGGFFAASVGQGRMWIDRKSGTMKYWTSAQGQPLQPVADGPSAVDAALQHVAKLGILSLAPEETIDVIRVAQVNGAMVERSTLKPVLVSMDQGPPAYHNAIEYVATLGRRYHGIPVLGSTLAVRLGRMGQLRGFQMHWRNFAKTGGSPVPIEPAPADVAKKMQAEAARIGIAHLGPFTIQSQRCGLVEAPIGRSQKSLRPGCRLQVRVGGGTAETDRLLTVALEPNRGTDGLYGP